MCALISLVYVSSTKGLFSEPELIELLKSSRRSNTKNDITGMLLYHDGNILQVLEGEEQKVDQLFSKIQRDPRHRGVIRMIRERKQKREFSDWRMSYFNISSSEIDGFSDFLQAPSSQSDTKKMIGKARRILYKFKEQLRYKSLV